MYNDSFKSRYTTIPFATYAGDRAPAKEDQNTLLHCHREMELLLMLEGEAVFQIDGRAYPAVAGDILAVSPYRLHATTFPAGKACRHVCLCFDLSLLHDSNLTTSLENGSSGVTPCVSHAHPSAQGLSDAIRRAFSAHASQAKGWEFCVVGALSMAFGTLLEHDLVDRSVAGQDRESFCYRAFHFLESHVGESVTSADAAEALYMSHGHFCRSFHAVFGHPFGEYLTMLRIERAEHLLARTDWRISRVAESVGFDSFSYFGKRFKETTGLSPSDYRRRVREEET